jgi:proteic killer suppression protein
MIVSCGNRKLSAALNDESECGKQYGTDMTRKIIMRIAVLRAAKSLADFWPPKSGSERCHELRGDLSSCFSIDLKQPYRLIFRAIDEENPQENDQLLRWQGIKKVEILSIEDTHG